MEQESPNLNPERKQPNYDLLRLAEQIISHEQQKINIPPEKNRLDIYKELVLHAIQENKMPKDGQEVLFSAVLTIETEANREGQDYRTIELAKSFARAFLDALTITDQSSDPQIQTLVKGPFHQICQSFDKMGVRFFERSFGIHGELIESGDVINLTPEELQQLVEAGIFETMMQTYPTESQSYKVSVLPMIGSFKNRPIVLAPGRFFSQQ